MRRTVAYVGVVATVMLVWWALTATEAVAPLLLPPVGEVTTALHKQLADPATWVRAMATTVARASAGFLLAAVVAVPLGIILGRNPLLRRAYEPLLATLTAVPLVILYPVFAATLGLGTSSKIVLGALYAFFPIAIAATRAVGQVDSQLVTASRSMGSRGAHLVRTVVVPSALPGIIAGLRLALGLALVTVIAAEFIAGSAGVGYELAAMSQGYNSADLLAWVVLAIGLTIAVNLAFTLLASLLDRSIRR